MFWKRENPALKIIHSMKLERKILLASCLVLLLYSTGMTYYAHQLQTAWESMECEIVITPKGQMEGGGNIAPSNEKNLIQVNYPLPVEYPLHTIRIAYNTSEGQVKNVIELFDSYAVVDNDLYMSIEGRGYHKILEYVQKGYNIQAAWMILYAYNGDVENLPTEENLEYLKVTGFIK